jgi:imidazolonepropionase-like amidohydrolase
VNHLEKETGSIAPGKSADMVVLDQDLFRIPVTAISRTRVLTTLFEGREVFGSLDRLSLSVPPAAPARVDLAATDDPH